MRSTTDNYCVQYPLARISVFMLSICLMNSMRFHQSCLPPSNNSSEFSKYLSVVVETSYRALDASAISWEMIYPATWKMFHLVEEIFLPPHSTSRRAAHDTITTDHGVRHLQEPDGAIVNHDHSDDTIGYCCICFIFAPYFAQVRCTVICLKFAIPSASSPRY